MRHKIKSMGLVILSCLSLNSYAEYYLVYPAPACFDCYEGNWVVHHYYHRYHHHHHRVHHHHIHHYGTEIYTSCWEPVSPCAIKRYHHDDYYYMDTGDPNYDPDLSTGDDDATVDPDMDIDH